MCKYAFCCIDTAALKNTLCFCKNISFRLLQQGSHSVSTHTHIHLESHHTWPLTGNVLWQHKSYSYTAQLMTIKWVEKAITVCTKSTSSVLTPNCSTAMPINYTLLRSERLKNTGKTNWIMLQPGARELNITVKLNQFGPWQSSS